MKVNEFVNWFYSAYAAKEQFAASAKAFQDIEKNTGGWSTQEFMYILNAALGFMEPDEQYLEIGTFCGRSLIGALKDNNRLAQVFDPFWDKGTKEAWDQAVIRFDVRDRITLYHDFCHNFSGSLPPIGVYFYDGNHDSGHTYEGLKRFEPYLADQALIIVDDYMIYGGGLQKPYPGHVLDLNLPVKTDTDRWLSENSNASLITITPWTCQQAIIKYERV